ncbi:MAG: AroM family protein [Bacillota bacterium]
MKLALITIGQSPRPDIVPELRGIWGQVVQVMERGALDGLGKEEIASMAPTPDDYVLVTRLADGSSVRIARRFVEPLVVKAIREMDAAGTDCILLLCTGDFAALETQTLLVKPDEVLHNTVEALAGNRTVGILTPAPAQVEQAKVKWAGQPGKVVVEAANPYSDTQETMVRAVESLKNQGAGILVMDCMGYTLAMKKVVREVSGLPTVLARSLLARVVAEILG